MAHDVLHHKVYSFMRPETPSVAKSPVNQADSKAAAKAANKAAKYLTFVLGHESYGIPVLKVREIIRLCELTAVPEMPAYVKGVLNLRGKIIPVADLRLKFKLGPAADGENTCIIVVEIRLSEERSTAMGLIVDAVEEVVNIFPSDIENTPDFGISMQPEYLLGMAKVKGKVKGLLDIDRAITAVTAEQLGFGGGVRAGKGVGA